MIKKFQIVFIIILFFFSGISVFSQNNWEIGKIFYKNGNIVDLEVKLSKNNYYHSLKTKGKKIYPKDVEKVQLLNNSFVSMFFSAEDYGIESYSFGKYIAGKNIILLKTKFLEKVCTCQRYGALESGYFLLTPNNELIRIYIDIKNYIINLQEINFFLEKYQNLIIPTTVKNINDLINFL